MQQDAFSVQVMAAPPPQLTPTVLPPGGHLALFDPTGETTALLKRLGIRCAPVDVAADLSQFDALIIGKAALTVAGAGPDITRVRSGLKVILFEQSAAVLEQRFGFRVAEYGLRQVFKRVPDHPLLAGDGRKGIDDSLRQEVSD